MMINNDYFPRKKGKFGIKPSMIRCLTEKEHHQQQSFELPWCFMTLKSSTSRWCTVDSMDKLQGPLGVVIVYHTVIDC